MNILNTSTTTNSKNSELKHEELESWHIKKTIDEIRQERKKLYRIYCRR